MSGYKPIFGVRGFWAGSPRNIIFLINGVTQADGFFDMFPLAQFTIPVEFIDRIEVIRGPMSVMYGPGSFFGAINIITDNKQNKFNSLFSASYGSRNTRKVTLRTTGVEGNLSFSLNGGYASSNGLDEPLSKMSSQAHLDKLPPVVNYKDSTQDRLENEYKQFNLHVDYKKFYADVSFHKSRDEIYLIFPSYSDGSEYVREITKINVGYDESFSEFFKLTAKFTYHQFNSRLYFDWWNAHDSGYSSSQSEMYESEIISYLKIMHGLQLTSGIYFKRVSDNLMNAYMHNFSQYAQLCNLDDIDLLSFYSQADYHFMDKFRFVAGFRLEQHRKYDLSRMNNPGLETEKYLSDTYEKDKIEFIPRVAAIYSINDTNIIKFLYGKAISIPSFFQNMDQMAAFRPNLETEKIQTFELNYIAVPLPQFIINTSFFYNILENLIVRQYNLSPQQTLITFSTNAGKMITKGFELTLQTQPIENLFVELSGTYQHTTDERDGFEDINVEYSPHLLGYLKGAYRIHNNIEFSISAHYVDQMDTHWIINQRLGNRTDDYFTVAANFRINDIGGKGWYLNLHGTNLLNEDYLYPTYTSNANWVDKGTTGEPFSLLFTIGRKY